ncbi:MAG TPA: hypothetical protein VGI23_10345 [Steroidobacteraceae bacterium]|jgi:hypothetical protein
MHSPAELDALGALIPLRRRVFEGPPGVAIARDYRTIGVAAAVFTAFTMTLGRGIS